MPRPRMYSDEVILRIYDLIRSKPRWGFGKVTAELEKALGADAPSGRTVSRIMGEVKRSTGRLSELEEPWRAWHETLPELQGAEAYLLRLAGGVQSLELLRTGDAQEKMIMAQLWDVELQADPWTDDRVFVPELTRLEARWAWRIHQGAPELCDFDVYWTVQDIVARIRTQAALSPGEEFDDSDIHFLLAMRPWSSPERHARYLELVRSDRIPPYRITPLFDLHHAIPSASVSSLGGDGEGEGRMLLPFRGDYSLISMFVGRRCKALDHIRKRALRNDFGFVSSWRGRTRRRLTMVADQL